MNEAINFNYTEFKERMMDDRELMLDVLMAMVEDTPTQIDLLKVFFQNNDLVNAGKAGHKIKGSAANVCCNELESLALRAEHAGKEGDSKTLEEMVNAIEKEWQILYPALKKYCEDLSE